MVIYDFDAEYDCYSYSYSHLMIRIAQFLVS